MTFFTPGTTFDNVQTQWAWNFNYCQSCCRTARFSRSKFGGYIQEQDEIPGEWAQHSQPAYDEFEDKIYNNWFGPFVADRERYLLSASDQPLH